MSTNIPKMPILTVENSTVSIEKVPKSIVTAEKVLLRFFWRKRTFFGKVRGNCRKYHRNYRKYPKGISDSRFKEAISWQSYQIDLYRRWYQRP